MSANKNTRTDPHRPGAIVPGEYTYLGSYDLGNADEPPYIDHELRELPENTLFAARGDWGRCSVCSARFRFGDIWLHTPTGEHIHIGHDCAAKYSMMTDRSAHELALGRHRAACARELEKKINAEKRSAFLSAHPGLEEALQTNHRIVRDIAARLDRFPSLSDKQVALVFKLAEEAKSPKPAEVNIPAPTGRVTFCGKIVKTDTYEGDWGTSYKMVVKVSTPDGVWLAWGTLPAGLRQAVPLRMQLKGAEVQVTATLSHGKEAHFAIMKRPIARLLNLAPSNT